MNDQQKRKIEDIIANLDRHQDLHGSAGNCMKDTSHALKNIIGMAIPAPEPERRKNKFFTNGWLGL